MSEPLKLYDIKQVATSTTAVDVTIADRLAYIKNIGDKAIYFKEKNGVACTSSNGYKLSAGEQSPKFFANTLSVVAAEGTPTICVMMLID